MELGQDLNSNTALPNSKSPKRLFLPSGDLDAHLYHHIKCGTVTVKTKNMLTLWKEETLAISLIQMKIKAEKTPLENGGKRKVCWMNLDIQWIIFLKQMDLENDLL